MVGDPHARAGDRVTERIYVHEDVFLNAGRADD